MGLFKTLCWALIFLTKLDSSTKFESVRLDYAELV